MSKKALRLQRQKNCRLGAILNQQRRILRIVAEDIEVGETTVGQWVAGKNVPSALVLADLCEYLNCTIDDIYPKGE